MIAFPFLTQSRRGKNMIENSNQPLCFIASTMEELIQCVAIRAVVYMGEEESSYNEEFDGNDFTATHILATIGDEPAGTIRIRYFGDFAKPERLAVLPTYRGKKIANLLASEAINICKRKGYSKLYGHCTAQMLPFWKRFGYEKIENISSFVWGGEEFFPIEANIKSSNSDKVININTPPFEVIRPEGDWDRVGIHEIMKEFHIEKKSKLKIGEKNE
jgi:predicted GNAT family N-acyltransferase